MKELIIERPNLFEPNVYITMCTTILGDVCPCKLAIAIKKAYKANETTMSKIVLTKGRAYYKTISQTGCKIEITQDDWLDIVALQETIPFALHQGELMRTFIIPNNNNTKLLIIAHHLVGDGKSILYFIKDIMTALTGVTLKYKPLPLLTKKDMSKVSLPILVRLYTSYCKYRWKPTIFSWQSYKDVHTKYWQNHTSDITYKTLSQEQTKEIIEMSKQIGCSVNSYLITLLLQKYNSAKVVGIPVSVRQKGKQAMANLVSGISIKHHFDNKKTVANNAIEIHHKIQQQLQGNRWYTLAFLSKIPPTLIDAVLLYTHNLYLHQFVKKVAKKMGYANTKASDLGVSNLAVADIFTKYGKYTLDTMIFVPPAVSYSFHVVGIITMNGKLTIAYHAMKQRN